jgi:hypothetical protein
MNNASLRGLNENNNNKNVILLGGNKQYQFKSQLGSTLLNSWRPLLINDFFN